LGCAIVSPKRPNSVIFGIVLSREPRTSMSYQKVNLDHDPGEKFAARLPLAKCHDKGGDNGKTGVTSMDSNEN
jgi:hypothetical protein